MATKTEISAADAAFLIDGLRHVASTVVINCGEIAAAKGSNAASVARRFLYIKNRYNLNIQTTGAGYKDPSKVADGKIVKRARGRPRNKKSAGPTESKEAAIKTLLEDYEGPSSRKSVFKRRLPAALPDKGAWDESFTPSE